MKILIDGRVLIQKFVTGVQLYARELLNAFNRLNIRYEVVYPPSGNRYLHHIWEHSLLPYKARKYDILFCPGNIAPLWKPSAFKLVITLHDLSFIYFPNSYSSAFRIYYKKVIPRVLSLSDAIITVSENEKKRINEYFPKFKHKVRVVPSGLRGKFKNVKIKYDKQNYILYVGSLNPRKNFQGVIKAFQKISSKIPHELRIVGGEFKIFKKVNLINSDRVRFLGYVDDDTLVELYSNCSLFVFPSFYEAFGFPVLEAMACGAPVITSNLSSLPEIADGAAVLVNPYDINELANAMLRVLEDRDLRDSLIRKGYERAQLFSWNKTAKGILSVFEEVLSKGER